MQRLSTVFVVFILLMQTVQYADAETPTNNQSFFEKHCLDCHGQTDPSGGLDLTTVGDQLNDPKAFDLWVKIHDRVRDGEMPPPKDHVIDDAVRNPWLTQVGQWLTEFDDARWSREGRATRRRLNRYEYENALRDLLDAPWLQVKNMLPEDGEAYRFNKSGDALDVSHVQIARYLAASESALRAVMADQIKPPEAKTTRYYARNSRAFSRKVQYSVFNKSPERATFPIIGFEADVDVLDDKAPMTVGDKDPERRELEAMGVVASSYEPLEIKFDEFKAPRSGRYKLRFNAFSFWAKPESEEKWWRPSRHQLEQGRTREPVTVYSETPPRLLRKIGNFEVNPEPNVYEIEVDLLEGETVRPDAVRLFRSRPPGPWQNPLAERDGQPGVAFRWLEVEGPIIKQWPPAGHQRMFADLPLVVAQGQKQPSVKPRDADHDARRLLQRFMVSAYREEVLAEDVDAFLEIISKAQESGSSFQDAMIAGYSAVLCSPAFVTIEERPGPLSDEAIATRLAFFLWNSPPDAVLRKLASQKQLRKPDVLREQTLRMLAEPRSTRFVTAFLDYWLDLRKIDATSPDAGLYPDYYLDDYLVESSVDETRAFFAELIANDLPSRNLVDSDFVIINERLAKHYGMVGVEGIQLRRVDLPEGHIRGGILTHASVLKVTANGTTTSPVLRGTWITERIFGRQVPPPPSAVPAVEPDTRGATTIREQLAKHRTLDTCNACHARIDPPGFALECFDVLGGYRKNYRKLIELTPEKRKTLTSASYGKNGQPFEFVDGPQVDASGELPSGKPFADITEMQRLLLDDPRQIARNLVNQLTIFATGAPVSFGDRPEVEAILDGAADGDYGVRELIIQLVQSPLFLQK